MGSSTSPRLLAVDGSFLLYRSFHALRNTAMHNTAGQPVWALHGALTALCKTAARLRPTHLVVALDAPGGCARRLDLAPSYKEGRTTPPPELTAQLREWPVLLAEIGVSAEAVMHWEADDVLASLARTVTELEGHTYVYTGDRDAFQLLNSSVEVVKPDGTLFGEAELRKKYGLEPHQYRQLAALRGEQSDNLPGVERIGEKTATKLLQAIGSLDESTTDEELVEAVGVAAAKRVRAGMDVFRLNMDVGLLNDTLDVSAALRTGALPLDSDRAAGACRRAGLRVAAVSVPSVFGNEPLPLQRPLPRAR